MNLCSSTVDVIDLCWSRVSKGASVQIASMCGTQVFHPFTYTFKLFSSAECFY